jgi:signal transduction histidine kinase
LSISKAIVEQAEAAITPDRPERLHTRVVTVLALLTIAPLVLGALISLVVSISLTRNVVTADQRVLASNIGRVLHERWDATIDDLRTTTDILVPLTSAAQAPALTSLYKGCAACKGLWLVDASGQIVQQAGTLALAPYLDAHAQAALRRGGESIPTIPSYGSAHPQVLIVIPATMPGGTRASLLALIDLQQFGSQALAPIHMQHEAYSYIADPHGLLIISPRPDLVQPGRDLQPIPLVNAALNGQAWEPPRSQDYRGLLAPLVDGVWYQIPDLGWYVLVEAPVSLSSAHNWFLFGMQSLLLLLTCVAAVVLSRRLAATITTPIEQLQSAVLRLQAGHWDMPIRIRRQDELGQLGLAFNAMAQEIHSKQLTLMTRSDELRLTNQELEQALAAARQAMAIKSQFVATISHELRTPLTAMLGFTELLELGVYGTLHGKQGHIVTRIHDNGTHLLQIINDLLDFSKLEAGKLELHEEQFNFADLITDAVNACTPLVRTKALILDTMIDPALPAVMDGDSLRLRQVLLNVLSNAVKFTEHGRIEVRALYEPAAQLHNQVGAQPAIGRHGGLVQEHLIIAISDTGIGIAADDLPVIFDDFHQVDAAFTRRRGGTGLGLAITRRLVELMHGTISVVSAPGQGSCFTIRLPLQTPKELGRPKAGTANEQ